MGAGTAVLLGLRVLVVLVAAAGIGLGAWALTIRHDIEVRGSTVLNGLLLGSHKELPWRQFFEAAVGSQIRIWIAITAAGFSFLAGIFIILSMKTESLKLTRYVLIPVELISMFAMSAAFGASLSLSIMLDSTCIRLDSSSSADLKKFEMLCPLSKGHSIGNGTGGFIVSVTALTALISICARFHALESCSFEPTASSLGMGHGYQAGIPATTRATIPTIYDPLKPTPGTPKRPPREDEIGLAEGGAVMGVRNSIDNTRRTNNVDVEMLIPIGFQRPEEMRNIRAQRPWSEMPKREVAE
ncbi:hypothetical protein K504DRAFT_489435 [Pleomassaria siparia CBS 279.74]|uniref:Uncharacterized protein n=1 Tax=Pleomassaria siparia CBS 279.74 TaxID=1314801 RepID=A0A6G1KFI5_9PLEO|nr:hypothetical protein K504DRAFT_489435 [Pleomassaria siparia CBS 279.74]